MCFHGSHANGVFNVDVALIWLWLLLDLTRWLGSLRGHTQSQQLQVAVHAVDYM